MKKILINAQREQELRIAVINDDGKLLDLNIESEQFEYKKSNIYKGYITRVEPSLEAVFVDYGEPRQGFLSFKDIKLDLYPEINDDASKLSEVLKAGQSLVVQIGREERGSKGAALTTHVSLAGQYLILIPSGQSNRLNGISRSASPKERIDAKELLDQLDIPDHVRVILRTSGMSRTIDELQWNLNYLVKLWDTIDKNVSESRDKTKLLYREGDSIMRMVRDYLRDDIDEVVSDNLEVLEKVKKVVQMMTTTSTKFNYHSKNKAIYTHYNIEQQIERIYNKKIFLDSGGEIVIDLTEALVAIDVNSGKATQGKGIEETALKTNLEAAEEIIKQMRLRDLGGLIVVDFIDMLAVDNRKQVENALINHAKSDKAKIKIGRISKFGLLELSRQRIGLSLMNVTTNKCDRCGTMHQVRSIDSLCQSIVGVIEEKINTKGVTAVEVQLPVDSATYLLNESRTELTKIESRHGVKIVVVANEHLYHPDYQIKTIGVGEQSEMKTSYLNKKVVEESKPKYWKQSATSTAEHSPKRAAVEEVSPSPYPKRKLGFFSRLFGLTSKTTTVDPAPKPPSSGRHRRKRFDDKNRGQRRPNTARHSRPPRTKPSSPPTSKESDSNT